MITVDIDAVRSRAMSLHGIDRDDYLLEIIETTFATVDGLIIEGLPGGVNLEPMEKAILRFLVQREGAITSKAQIVDHLRSLGSKAVSDRFCDVYICRIRRKMPQAFGAIETVWGEGVVFHAGKGQAK